MIMDNQKIKTVYIVRHGQTLANIGREFQGSDSKLSDVGRAQAKVVADRAAKLDFKTIIASPFPRAHETAEAISKVTGIPITNSELFIERTTPKELDGKSWDDEEAIKIWRKWSGLEYTAGFKSDNGESFDEIIDRADQALKYLEELPETSILVVSHGYFIRTLVARILLGEGLTGDALKRIVKLTSTQNTGITVIKFSEAFEEGFCWRLVTYNDHAHYTD